MKVVYIITTIVSKMDARNSKNVPDNTIIINFILLHINTIYAC